MRHQSLKYVPQWYWPYRVRCWLGRGEVMADVFCGRWTLGLHYQPFRGYRLASFQVHVAGCDGPVKYYPHFGDYMVSKRQVKKDDPQAAIPSAKIDTKFFRTLPCLLVHCTATQYEDKSIRKPGWFTVGTYGMAWRVTVKDPDSAASISVTAPTLDEALTAAEAVVSDPASSWEHDEWLESKKPRRKRS